MSSPLSPMPETLRTQVAVVGAGPVGTLVANYLGGYGVDVVLLDRETEVIDYPRAIGMDDECLRSLQGVGLASQVARDLIQNIPLRFFDATGRCFADVRPATREFGWFRRNIFMQPKLEQTLRAGLERYPHVRFLTGHEVVGLEQNDSGARLAVRGPAGAEVQVQADYVVAADGGRSPVRELLGIRLEGQTHPRKWVVIDASDSDLDAAWTALHCNPRRPYVCAHLPDGYRRWEFMLFDGEDSEEMLQPDKVHELLSHHVDDPSSVHVVRARVYTHHSRLAERFVQGRVLLAGDAAHLMPPWAGQGMNTGVRDATNLAWKLAAVIRGLAAPALLATYEQERREHARAMIDLSTTLGRILSPTRRSVARARDLLLRGATWAPAVREWIVQMRFKPMPVYRRGLVVRPEPDNRRSPVGRMFPQPLVELSSGESAPLDDVLGPWFAVLGFETDPAAGLSARSRKFLDGLDARFVMVVKSRTAPAAVERIDRDPATVVVQDVEGHLTRWFERRDRVVLLRPDRYVAAVAQPAAIDGAVTQIRHTMEDR